MAPMLNRLPSRLVFAAVFVACAGLIGFGLVLQHVKELEPCPMCILQRYAFVAIGTVALVAAIHGPVGVGVKVYSFLLAAFAVAGGSVSVRQSLLQRFPAPEPANCMAGDLDFLLGGVELEVDDITEDVAVDGEDAIAGLDAGFSGQRAGTDAGDDARGGRLPIAGCRLAIHGGSGGHGQAPISSRNRASTWSME